MSAHDRQPPFYLGIDLGGTNIKSGVVDDAGSRSPRLAWRPRPSGAGGRESPTSRKRAVGRCGERSFLGRDRRGRTWLDRARWTCRGGMLLEPPNLPGWDQLPIRDLLAEEAGEADCASERRQRRGLRRILGRRGAGTRAAWFFSPWARESAAESSKRADHRGPAQPRRRMRPHHHPDGERPPVLMRRVRASGGLCLGHRPGEARRRGAESRLSPSLLRTIRRRAHQPGNRPGSRRRRCPGQPPDARDRPLPGGGHRLPDAHDRPGHRALQRRHDRRRSFLSWRTIRNDIRAMAFPTLAHKVRVEYAALGRRRRLHRRGRLRKDGLRQGSVNRLRLATSLRFEKSSHQ